MKRTSLALAALFLAAPATFAQTNNPAPAVTAPMKSGDAQFYSRQATDMRASNLIGANVTNMANETVGEINDLVVDKDGKVVAVVVGVGGFLGIGEREVALNYSSLNIKYDANAMTNAGATTKDGDQHPGQGADDGFDVGLFDVHVAPDLPIRMRLPPGAASA